MKTTFVVLLLLAVAVVGVWCTAGQDARALKDKRPAKVHEEEDDDEISIGSFFSSIFGFFQSGFASVFGSGSQAKEARKPTRVKRVSYKRFAKKCSLLYLQADRLWRLENSIKSRFLR